MIESFFSNKSYQAERFFSKNICSEIIDIINKNQYEYILFEGVFPAVYLEEIKKTVLKKLNFIKTFFVIKFFKIIKNLNG